MLEINTDQHLRCVLKPARMTAITLVGVGGTGSALAIDLARLVYHCREKGMDVRLQLVDHDLVETSNVGRQQFSPHEVGMNKAVSMAHRLNLWLGLDVVGLPKRFTWKTPLIGGNDGGRHILVGAVDNWTARKAIAGFLDRRGNNIWWVDAGNGKYTGQVLVGNRRAGSKVEINSAFGLVSGIPSPGAQMPTLLEEAEAVPVVDDGADCALMVLRDEQSLNVNRMMAVFAAQAIYDIVVRNQVTTMASYLSLSPPSATSHPITEERLKAFGLGVHEVGEGGKDGS